tara:strand:+ start:1455 stop:1724 length:270 start_codon:yes stop_codon:yes gene_type:complete
MKCEYYDLDDYRTVEKPDNFDLFEVGGSDMDIYDFDHSLDNILDELEAEILKAGKEVEEALLNGESRARIERLEDELVLLTLNYNQYER